VAGRTTSVVLGIPFHIARLTLTIKIVSLLFVTNLTATTKATHRLYTPNFVGSVQTMDATVTTELFGNAHLIADTFKWIQVTFGTQMTLLIGIITTIVFAVAQESFAHTFFVRASVQKTKEHWKFWRSSVKIYSPRRSSVTTNFGTQLNRLIRPITTIINSVALPLVQDTLAVGAFEFIWWTCTVQFVWAVSTINVTVTLEFAGEKKTNWSILNRVTDFFEKCEFQIAWGLKSCVLVPSCHIPNIIEFFWRLHFSPEDKMKIQDLLTL
jgi:hypothetical protein